MAPLHGCLIISFVAAAGTIMHESLPILSGHFEAELINVSRTLEVYFEDFVEGSSASCLLFTSDLVPEVIRVLVYSLIYFIFRQFALTYSLFLFFSPFLYLVYVQVQ